MTIDQGHQKNGKWDFKEQSDPTEPLTSDVSDEIYNSDGTFHYPVKARSAEQAVAFWAKVDVDDEALSELQQIYSQNREEWLVNADTAWSEQWEADYEVVNPRPSDKLFSSNRKPLEIWETTKAATFEFARKDHLGSIWDQRAQVIGNSDARTVARVLGLATYTRQLPDAERAKVLSHIVSVDQKDMSVGDIYEEFALKEINPMKLKSGNAAKQLAEMREISSAVIHQTSRMGVRFEELTTQIKELRRDTIQIADPAMGRPY